MATMRAAMSNVEQTLAAESAAVLQEAVAEARRRGHAQTTSLHVAAALLTSPGSKLRQACIRSHPGSSAHPLHCRALQLCFNVALDRLPTAGPAAEAALSNALVAAVKRAQAQQRRACPEQQQQPLLAVRVELDFFILSILDDPSVSRVMSEASFSSTCVKSHLLRMALAANSASPSTSSLIRAPSRGLFATSQGDDARRVADVLGRPRRRNPVLVGNDVAECEGVVAELAENVEALVGGARVVGAELSVGDDVDARLEELKGRIEAATCAGESLIVNLGDLTWLAEGGSERSVRRVVAELGELVVKYGGGAAAGGRRLWLMGIATCEMYMRCQARHPLMESTWDLQLVPIAASRPGAGMLPRFGGQGNICSSFQLHTTSASFPAITLTPRKPIKGIATCNMSCCPECMVHYKKELLLVEEKDILQSTPLSSKPSDQELLFPWWLPSEKSIHSSKGSDVLQAKDQDTTWNHKVEELQNKWNVLCRSLHPHFHGLPQNVLGKDSQVSTGLSSNALSRSKISHDNRESQLGICYQPKGENMNHKNSDSHWWLQSKMPSFTEVSTGVQVQHVNFDLKTSSEKQRQIEQSRLSSFSGHLEACSSSVTSVRTDLALGRTRLLPSSPGIKTVLGHKQIMENHKERLKDLTSCMSSDIDLSWKTPDLSLLCSKAGSVNSHMFFPWKSSAESVTDAGPQGLEHRLPNRQNVKFPSDVEAFKRLSEGLKQRVSWQHEVVSSVTHAVVQCISGNRKYRGVCRRGGDMWLLFLGPDRFGKRNIAAGLSEIIFEGEKSFICLGLNCQEHNTSSNLKFGQQSFLGCGSQFRGKTILDQIADAVKKNPFSVMLLEDIDQADSVVQSSLIQAAAKGRLSDSYGREVSIGDVIFVLTAGSGTNNHHDMPKKENFFPEEKLMEAQGWQMQIIVESARFEVLISKRKRVSVINYDNQKETEELEQVGLHFGSANKRKIDHLEVPVVRLSKHHKTSTLSLDLNLAVGYNEAEDDSSTFDGQAEVCEGFGFDSSDLTVEQIEWDRRYFKELSPLLDNMVTFMPFDLDNLAERVVETISRKFLSIIGSDGLLDIDKNVIQQILATIGFTFDGMKAFEEWAEQVFGSSLSEVIAAYTISANTIVKLVTVKELFSGQSPGLLLPKSIFLKKDATREGTGKHT